jgi:para-nitrobenzyl esterase
MIRRLILCIAAAMCFTSPALAETTPVVDAPAGQMQGQAEGGIRVFKGIPYALPPVGPARWKPPASMPRWGGLKNTTAYGPACLQPVSHVPNIYSNDLGAMSEDCLTLNVWAPADAHNAPVFFWIHGGALVGGSSKESLYDGARLAARGVVVVTINYRLGVLGWLAHPELSAESPLHISGNYGLLDQIEALRWVKRNIGAFGGDGSNVTIAGESAGGLSVMYLLASPEARGLFAKAIAESAYMVTVPTLKESKYGEPSAEDSGAHLAAALHAPNIAALRAMDAATLATAAPAAGFMPLGAVDGHILPGQLVDIFDKGEQAHVPLLAGFNAGEIRSLRILAPPPAASAAAYESTIHDRYKDLADDFLKLYPSSNMQESIWATTRDALYGWTAERLAKKQTAIGQPAFLYLFDHGYPAEDDAGYHAFHASELPFVFGMIDRTAPLWPKIPATPQEAKLSDAMVGYWTSFARTGRPQATGEPDWPAYDSTAAYMAFREAPHPSDHLMPGMYALVEQVVCRRHASGDQPWHWNVGLASPPLPAKPASCP